VELQELNAAEHRGTRPLPPSYNIAVSRAAAGISTPSRAAACTSTPSRAAACTSTPVDTAALTEEETRFSKVDPGTAGAAEPPPNYEHIGRLVFRLVFFFMNGKLLALKHVFNLNLVIFFCKVFHHYSSFLHDSSLQTCYAVNKCFLPI